jgi:hypothetical protein
MKARGPTIHGARSVIAAGILPLVVCLAAESRTPRRTQEPAVKFDATIARQRACRSDDLVYFASFTVNLRYSNVGTRSFALEVGPQAEFQGSFQIASSRADLESGRSEFGIDLAESVFIGSEKSIGERVARLLPGESFQAETEVAAPVRRMARPAIPATIAPGGRHVLRIVSYLRIAGTRHELSSNIMPFALDDKPILQACQGV